MTLDKIQTILDSKDVSPEIRSYLEIISEAMNDWPTSIESFENYVNQIESFITGSSNKRNLDLYLMSSSYSTDAWKLESISSVIKLYNFFDHSFTLSDINKKISSMI